MYFGAHVSIAGGVQNAPLNAAKIGCEVFQMFSRSPQGGPAPKLTDEILKAFQENVKAGGFHEWVIHTPYYINLASAEERIRKSSIRIIREELERASLLKARYVMFHPGSAKDVGEAQAIKFVIAGMREIYKGYKGSAELLIEISAGAGMVIGDAFEEVAKIIRGVSQNPVKAQGAHGVKLGVCFDTAHAFASGYDLRTKKAVQETFTKFDKTIGLERLKMMHLNDSKVDLNAHRDRHEHLGEGFIGLEGFRAIVGYAKLKHINLYCETEPDGVEEDLNILKKMRGER